MKYALGLIITDYYADKRQFYENDRYALHKTFRLNYESMKRKIGYNFAVDNQFTINLCNSLENENKLSAIR